MVDVANKGVIMALITLILFRVLILVLSLSSLKLLILSQLVELYA